MRSGGRNRYLCDVTSIDTKFCVPYRISVYQHYIRDETEQLEGGRTDNFIVFADVFPPRGVLEVYYPRMTVEEEDVLDADVAVDPATPVQGLQT